MATASPCGDARAGRASRDPTVDTLRGVAILGLMLEHAMLLVPGIDMASAFSAVAERMGSAVELFFVLSGFVVTAALERSLAHGERWTGYLLRRASKILPLYFLFLHLNIAGYLAMARLLPGSPFPVNSPSLELITPGNYLAHLLFLQGFAPRLLHSLLDGSWSIVCEVYFYLSLPFLAPLLSNSARACAGFALSLGLVIAYTMTLGRTMPSAGYYTFPAQTPCFVLGILCWRLRQEFPRTQLQGATSLWLAVSALLLFFGVSKSSTAPLGIHMVLIVLFAVLLMLLRVGPVRSLPLRVLQTLGQQSYALFFLHLLLLKLLYVTILTRHPEWPLPFCVALNAVVGIGGAWVLSWAVFDRVDRYFVRRADEWLRARLPVRQAAT